MDHAKRRMFMGFGAFAVIVVVVFGGTRLYQVFFGGKIGEKCEEHLGCMPGGVCISHHCQKRCSDDGDCPSGYGCASTAVTVTHQVAVMEEKKSSSEEICFPLERLRALRTPAPPPRPAPNPMQDPIWKKIDVRTQVVVKSIPLAAKKPVTIDDASFDKAWNAIPEADQRSATADALADRVLQALIAAQR